MTEQMFDHWGVGQTISAKRERERKRDWNKERLTQRFKKKNENDRKTWILSW